MVKRILTIDGGGLRGVFSAAIIEKMESVTGKPANELFDCFYGTSTGAILAAGLALGKSASQLKGFYLEKGADIFEKLPIFRIVKRLLYWTYTKKNLEDLLRKEFGEVSLYDVDHLLCVLSKNTATSTTKFFNNFPYSKEQHPNDEVPLWQAVRASTAAPTFFEPEGQFIDGGVSSYNNPSYAAYIGATKYMNWQRGNEHLRIYSVGTGYHPPIIPAGEADEQNKLQMAAYTVNELMDDINLLQNQIMSRLRDDTGDCWYKRYTIRFDPDSFEHMGIPVDGIDFDAISAMDNKQYVQRLAEIGEIVGERLVTADDFG